MSDRTRSTGSREVAAREQIGRIAHMAEAQRDKYAKLLPSHISYDDFRNAFMVAIQRNMRLLEADETSLWLALQRAAGMGLLPDGREGALVIFGDDTEDEDGKIVASTANKKKIVQWMPMIRGMIQLVRNTGLVNGLRARLVYKGEDVEVTDEDGAIHYRHVRRIDPDFDDSPEKVIGAYAVVNYKDGAWEMVWMSRRQIERRRAVSRAKNGPWKGWWDEMARKTVLHHLIKTLPQSPDLRTLEKALDDDLTIEGETEPAPREQEAPRLEQRQEAPIDLGLDRAPRETVRTQQESPPPIQQRQEPSNSGEDAPLPLRGARPAAPAPDGGPKPAIASQPRQDGGKAEPAVLQAVVTQPAAQPAAPPPFEAYATDETGEPLDPKGDGEFLVFHNPGDFVHWLECRMEITTSPPNLRENNMDAIAEAANDPALLKRMLDATAAAVKRLSPPIVVPASADDGGFPGDAPASSPPSPAAVMPPPLTPGGKPHWPNYAAYAKEIIDALATVEDVNAWEDANRPTYEGKAIQATVEKHLRARYEAFKPKADHDAEWAADAIAAIAKMKAWDHADGSVMSWVRLTTTATKMPRLRQERPELFEAVDAAIAKKRAELGA